MSSTHGGTYLMLDKAKLIRVLDLLKYSNKDVIFLQCLTGVSKIIAPKH